MKTSYDLCNIIKLNANKKSKNSENNEKYVLKCFKFFDLKNEGFINFECYLKSIERLGIFKNEVNFHIIKEVYNNYTKNNLFDYTQFLIELYPVNYINLNNNNYKNILNNNDNDTYFLYETK